MRRMRKLVLIALPVLVAVAALSWVAAAHEQAADAKGSDNITQLGWLAGAWVSEDDGGRSEEHWMTPRGDSMFGMNRTIRKPAKDTEGKERTVLFEFLQIMSNAHGIAYLASPAGRHPPTVFRMIECQPDRVVFENLQHDFPNRVIYWRDENVLHARIEGTKKGEPASQEWTWRRDQ